jgi:3-dehydroquinate synthase
MDRHDFDIPVTFRHRVIFTRDAFSMDNTALADILAEGGGRRALVFLESAVAASWKGLTDEIHAYFGKLDLDFRGLRLFAGGEACKADEDLVREVWREIDLGHIDRHSYVLVIGGGAFLDAVGFAASTAHRGVRLVRFPTTTLSQDDSGVGVKSAINAFGKKNWIGNFSVPFAVINDFRFLATQDGETSRAGLIEAVKVALVKDGGFFAWIEKNAAALAKGERGPFEECVKRSALLHARHIALGGDAFETGSSRPLDFGHWAAHKLEALTGVPALDDAAITALATKAPAFTEVQYEVAELHHQVQELQKVVATLKAAMGATDAGIMTSKLAILDDQGRTVASISGEGVVSCSSVVLRENA